MPKVQVPECTKPCKHMYSTPYHTITYHNIQTNRRLVLACQAGRTEVQFHTPYRDMSTLDQGVGLIRHRGSGACLALETIMTLFSPVWVQTLLTGLVCFESFIELGIFLTLCFPAPAFLTTLTPGITMTRASNLLLLLLCSILMFLLQATTGAAYKPRLTPYRPPKWQRGHALTDQPDLVSRCTLNWRNATLDHFTWVGDAFLC